MIQELVLGAVALVAIVAYLAVRASKHQAEMAAVGRIAAATRLLQDGDARPEGSLAAALNQLDRAVEVASASSDLGFTNQERIELALSAIPHAVIVVDMEGSVVFLNQAASLLEEARHGDAVVRGAVTEALEEVLKTGVDGAHTVDLYGPPRRTVVVTTTPLRSSSSMLGAVGVVEDVTEHRRIDAVRRDFVANISHELKTPVGAISLLAETLLGEDDPEVLAHLANRMVDEADRVNRTIDDLLVLSRIEHQEDPQHDPVPVRLLLAEAVERIRPAGELRSIGFDVDEPPPDLAVSADRRQVVSAVFNLLENAVKYSDEGSTVLLRAGCTAGDEVAITVEDHGIGIPAKDLERVFERFYRVDQGRSRQTGGTGLGLAIVRHVAANHGGEVTVSSRLGVGSTFTLVLPGAVLPAHSPSLATSV